MGTWKQSERQRVRSRGQYSVMNRCEVCGVSLGVDYCTDGRTGNVGLGGLVLCADDHRKGLSMNEDAASTFYRQRQTKLTQRGKS